MQENENIFTFFSLVLYISDFVVLLVYFFSVRQSEYVRLCFSTDSYRHMHTDTQPDIQTAFTHECTYSTKQTHTHTHLCLKVATAVINNANYKLSPKTKIVLCTVKL